MRMTPGLTSDTAALNKIAEITLYFWILKILATTLGEASPWRPW